MNTTFRGISRFWAAGFTLLLLGSLSACISDDGDQSDEDETGGSSASGGTGGSSAGSGGTGGSSAGTGGSSAGTGGGGPAGTACETPIVLDGSVASIATFDDYDGATGLDTWSFPFGGDAATGVFLGTFGYGDDEGGLPETFEMADGNDSTYALRIADTLAEEYGGGLGLWISGCLDATTFEGVSFWVRGNSPSGDAKFSLLMNETTADTEEMPGEKIGTCPGTDTGDLPTCVHPSYLFPVTDTWTQIEIAWNEFTAGNAVGTIVRPDGHNIWQFQVDVGLVWAEDDAGVYHPTPDEYEFEIDNVTFY
jgi:hypothetical protein